MLKKYLSRKFLVAIAAIITTILVSLGYDVDTEVTQLAVAIAGLYILVEGLIDIKKKWGSLSSSRLPPVV